MLRTLNTLFFLLTLATVVHAEPITMDLEQIIDAVLANDRSIQNSADLLRKQEITRANAKAAFDFRSQPALRGGMAGGGKAGSNPAIGGGYTFSKLFSRGSFIQVSPQLFMSKGIFRDHHRIIQGAKSYEANVSVLIKQPLLRGISKEYNLNAVEGAEFSVRNAKRRQYQEEVGTIVRAVSSSYRVVQQRMSLALKADIATQLEKALRSAKLKEKIGLADAMDGYRAELEYKQAEQNLRTAEELYQDSLDTLKEMIGIPLDSDLLVEAPLSMEQLEIEAEEAVSIALAERIEIDQVRDTILNAQRLERIANHNTWPQLDWVFNYSMHGRDQVFTRAWSHLNTNQWGLGFSASGDFDYAARKRGLESSRLDVAIAERMQLDVENRITLEVKRGYRQLIRARTRIETQEEKLKQAEGKLKLAEMKFEKGLASNFDLVAALRERHAASESLLSALIEYLTGMYRFRQSLGTLVEKPMIS